MGQRDQLSRLAYIIHAGSVHAPYKIHIYSRAWMLADASERTAPPLLHQRRARHKRRPQQAAARINAARINMDHLAREAARGAARSVADDRHQDVGQNAKSQAQRDHAGNFANDLAWSWAGADIFHEKWRLRFVRSRRSERATANVAHGVLQRGDPADMRALPV